jgi:hypothetical protein
MCAFLAKRVFAMSVQSSAATDKAVARALKDVATRIDSAMQRSGRTQPVSCNISGAKTNVMSRIGVYFAAAVSQKDLGRYCCCCFYCCTATAAATGLMRTGAAGCCKQDKAS